MSDQQESKAIIVPVRMSVAELVGYTDEVFIDHALKSIREIFEESGKIRPMAEVMATINPSTMKRSAGHLSVVLEPAHFDVDDGSKDFVSFLIKKMVRDLDAVAYMFTSECWMIQREKDDPMDIPSEAEDRKEMVQVILEFKNPRKEMFYTASIIREGASVELGPWDKWGNGIMGGRFSGVFKTKEDFS